MAATALERAARGQQHPAICIGTNAAAANEKAAVTKFKISADLCDVI
jgi:hypothetical protein